MLDQFYSYLSDKIIEFFKDNPLTSGAKYNIQFETEEQVENLYEALKENSLKEDYEYLDKDGSVKYRSYLLDFSGVKLIIASTKNNVQPDFLTRLRNMVGLEPGYEDKAILFIHNTTLDSIMGGTESFAKEGMPFYIDSIQRDIKIKLQMSNFSEVDREIINLDLERKKSGLFGESKSVFEYRDLLEIINGTCIEKEQYRNFGLFADSELYDLTGKHLKKRLKENINYFAKVDEIHNYGNPEVQLERYFEEKGIDKLKGEDWRNVDFKDVIKSVEEKKKIKPLEYINGSEGWDKEEGTSKAKSRIRNIIVFNEDNLEEYSMEFSFDDHLKKEFLKVDGDAEATTSGKKIKVKVKNTEGRSNFYKITYKNDKNVKFEFRIAMVKCSEKYLESIKTKFSVVYKKNKSYILVNTNESSMVLNEFASSETVYEVKDNYQTIPLTENEKLVVKFSESFEYENDSDLINFKINIKGQDIPFAVKGSTEKPTVVEGLKVWKLKREKECDFKLVGEDKLQHGTREFFTRGEFRKNLSLEKQIIDLEGLYFEERSEGLEAINLELSSELTNAYGNIISYYKLNKKLPSLTYINDDLRVLYEIYIQCYIRELNNIEEGSYVTKREKDLFKLGVVKRQVEDREILFTPLHPLNIAYQLKMVGETEDEELNDEIIKKFTSTYLLPYICEEDKLYIPMEQFHSPEWKYYVDQHLPRYKSSRDFVAKLVYEKIEEFVGHFKYMFNMGGNAPIRINLINTGDSKEILQGIFKYYLKQLKATKNSNILPIELFIYSDKNITNAFEELALNDNIESIKNIYAIDLLVDNMSEEDVLNLYREKVQFYTKKISDGIEYAHITFLEMNDAVKTVTSNMDDIPSGIIMNGLISGVPSVFLGDSYRTGFGIKYANTDTNLMNISIKLNALNSALSGEPFNSNQCKAISISNNSRITLDNIYDASHWVTFIDPKVDLNFFKNDPEAKDLLIIHYSDQYTTAGGYDAITVTRKSGPYQRVIEEFLSKNKVENAEEFSPNIINMFNAINGDWLLRLLSSKLHFPKEKISILSAIKLALAKFRKDNMIWVPISLEEVLRVSGGAGLKQNDGFFSAKNLGFDNGVTSDDILLVGIEEIEGRVFVNYYPVEVKIGINENSYVHKGIEQAKSTKKIFNKTLLPDENGDLTSTQKVYRNFLMQLVITSAEKLNLYNVCSEENWINIIGSDLRRKLLNEEYEISNRIEDSIGEAAVISFKKGSTSNISEMQDNVMVVEMSEDDGINFITKTVGEIRSIVDSIAISDADVNEAVILPEVKTIYEEEVNINGNEILDEASVEVEVVNEHLEESSVKSVVEKIENRNMEILFGINQNNNKEILWCPNDTNKVFHTNTGIIGTMGTGKTQFTKSVITQIHRESKNNIDGKEVGILIFDYKGDYNKSKTDFIEATNAKVYKLFNLPFNPFSISLGNDPMPMLPYHIASTFAETIVKAFSLGKKQEALLGDLIIEAYERRGIYADDPETYSNLAPTLKDVYDVYESREDIKKDDSLYAAFRKLIMFKIFEVDPAKTKSLFELIEGVTVVDLSLYDPGIQNLVVAITLDLFYSQMQAHGHSKIDGSLRQLNKIILVDEADNFLSKNFESLKKILKEGREFGVGTILSTQLLSHFSTGENDYANYILTWVIHNVADLNNKDVKYIFNTQSKQEEEHLFNKIKSLNKHYSLVKMGDSDRPIYMKDRAFWELDK